jgi:choline-sulfatase
MRCLRARVWFRSGASLAGLVCQLACSPPMPPDKPAPKARARDANVLLITIDTLRADHLSCYGSKKVQTPRLDGLASRGVRFDQAIAQVPLTTPSHASILTGTYSLVNKIRDNGGFVLDNQIPTLAGVTKEAGFHTAAIVAASVLHHQYGLNRGFDVYQDDMNEQARADILPGVVAEIRGEVVTKRALEWLESSRRKGIGLPDGANFFLWVHFYDPHFPYDPPAPYRSKYARNLYSGEVAFVDEQAGKLLKALADFGMEERTLVFLMADHGEGLGDHGEYTHGVFLYDATVRVPMIVAGPGIPRGQVISQQVRTIDVMPTVTAYLGLSAGDRVQGVSLMPAIVENRPVSSNYAYLETLYPKTSHGWSELRAMRTDQWKLIAAPKSELYNLAEDHGEASNVLDRYPAAADQLQKKMWEITGPPESFGKLETRQIDEKTMRELQSLGYASAGRRRDIRVDMSGPDPKDRIHVLKVLDDAADLMNHDRFAAAIPSLERILNDDPANPLIYGKLGACYQRTAQFAKAADVYRRAIQSKADTDQTHAELGNIHVRRGELVQAVASMEEAAEMNLANLQNLTNLATAYLDLGRLAETERVLKAILTQSERHSMAQNLYGILEIQRGDGNRARVRFEKAIELNPELSEAYMNLGLLAEKAGQPQIAIDYYKKFLARARLKEHREYIPKVRAAIQDLGGKL